MEPDFQDRCMADAAKMRWTKSTTADAGMLRRSHELGAIEHRAHASRLGTGRVHLESGARTTSGTPIRRPSLRELLRLTGLWPWRPRTRHSAAGNDGRMPAASLPIVDRRNNIRTG